MLHQVRAWEGNIKAIPCVLSWCYTELGQGRGVSATKQYSVPFLVLHRVRAGERNIKEHSPVPFLVLHRVRAGEGNFEPPIEVGIFLSHEALPCPLLLCKFWNNCHGNSLQISVVDVKGLTNSLCIIIFATKHRRWILTELGQGRPGAAIAQHRCSIFCGPKLPCCFLGVTPS